MRRSGEIRGPAPARSRPVGRIAALLSALIAIAIAIAMPATAGAQGTEPANPPWPQTLPEGSAPRHPQPGPVRECGPATLKCVRRVVRRLRSIQDRLGCDHRAVFATTYLVLTKVIRDTIRRNPRFYRYRGWLIYQDVIFARYYFIVLRDEFAGRRIPQAWRIAFDVAARGDANAAQDMLLGINAHVQRDMPYVLAEIGLRTRRGASRKPDHDRSNEVLARAYQSVVGEVERRYDPFMSTSNPEWTTGDDNAGLELVKGWREGVWRSAQRLLNAHDRDEWLEVSRSIERNAELWARSIASGEMPAGHREVRRDHCVGALG